MNNQYDYEKAWKEEQEFQSKELPASALKVVDEIYLNAKKEKNSGQAVKAIIHQLKLLDNREENAIVKNLQKMQQEIKLAEFPVKPLLHSMLAEMYWRYYQNNQYEFASRSAIVNLDETDLETWSIDKIVQETYKEYQLSLLEPQKSKAEKIEIYHPVINEGNKLGRAYRPTLFDFLAHRALDFFSSTEPDITKPAYYFALDKEDYLAASHVFSELQLVTRDTLSSKFQALLLFQELERFHLHDAEPGPLVNVSLKRMAFVRKALTLPNKNELYYNSLDELEKRVMSNPIVGVVTRERGNLLVETAALYQPLQSDKYKWDLKKAYNLCEEGKKRFPDSDGAILCENLHESILDKSVSATIEEVNVPEQPFRALIHYRNFTDLYYRIIKTSRNEIRTLKGKIEAEYRKDYNIDREQKFIEYFVSKSLTKKGKFILPDDGDYQQHSIEIKLDALPAGEYVILLSASPEFDVDKNGIAYGSTVVSNLSYIHRNVKDGSVDFYVLHRDSGEPIAGVEAHAFSHKYNNKSNEYEPVPIGTYTSDSKGFFKVPYIKSDSRRDFFVHFKKGNDTNSMEPLEREHYYHAGSLYQYKAQDPQEHIQTFFFLDRAIYRPGQTVYFKGLVIATDEKKPAIRAGYETTVTLYDVNGDTKGTIHVKTNEFGTFSGTFIAPSSGLTGEMTIESDDSSGQISFSVEEYKRPKFEVVFEAVKGSFKLNDKIKVDGFARAYSGAAIDGAQVSYRIVRQAKFPFWWWCRWGYYPTSPEVEIANGLTKTDAVGKFAIDFTAIPDKTVDPLSEPTFAYEIYVDVTDINGETHSNTSSVTVGYKALKVGVTTPNINKDEQPSIQWPITTTNLAGEFEPAKGEIKIYQLKAPAKAYRNRLWLQADRALYTQEEYHQFFSQDLYADENNKFKWDRANEVFVVLFNTELKKEVVLENLNQWSAGEYVLEITSQDKYGQAVKEVSYFTVFSPSAKIVPTPTIHYFQLLKWSAEPGEKASFIAGTSEPKINVLYEIEKDGIVLSKEWLTIKDQRAFEIPVKEEYRGNIGVHYTFIKNNRLYARAETIFVPYTNKQLDIRFESFRDKLKPGEDEEWRIRVAAKSADKVLAEMVATLYDESLDEFRMNDWQAAFYYSYFPRVAWQSSNDFSALNLRVYNRHWNDRESRSAWTPSFDSFNWFGYRFYDYRRYARYDMKRAGAAVEKEEALAEVVAEDIPGKSKDEEVKTANSQIETASKKETRLDLSEVKVRKNFNETAFFYPHLTTNDKGEILIKFTVPEALTRWKMLGFAHSKELQSGVATNHLVTQKELMVVPNPPRFFREHDAMSFSIKISSLVDAELSGQAQLEFFDALTMKPINEFMKNNKVSQSFSLKPKQSTVLKWNIEIPEGVQAIMYRVVAKAGNFSDGEEMVLPVVTNRMLVTETLPLPIRGKQEKHFVLDKLVNTTSATLRHQRLTLEFTSNPAWYAIQALPYMMEYPYDCVEQSFSKFYANSIASHIANSNPRIKQVFDTWKNIQPEALLSSLEKNQELKNALLEETPWVMQAKNESQRKRTVALLFDLNRMAEEQDRALTKVINAQASSGGFSWFPGMPEDRYMTQHIVSSLGHLDVMGVKSVQSKKGVQNLIKSALQYMDSKIVSDYNHLLQLAKKKEINLDDNHIHDTQFQYLYARSYFKDIAVTADAKPSFEYFLGQAKKYWNDNPIYLQGMICLSLHRFGDIKTPIDMIKSFSERALHSEEMGMYWKLDRGYWWYQAPIETMALMIEVYDEVASDAKSVEDMKVWLLKQKQTQDWKTTKATSEACYGLLRRGINLLAGTNLVDIKVGDQKIDPLSMPDTKVEAGTGYFKTAWQANEITSSMGRITVSKNDGGVAWGAVYWQYFEQLDKITAAETPLKLKKDLFVQQNTDKGPVISPVNDKAAFKIGDLVKVRIELRADRDMEYVHLKDMRAAGFEPVSTLSIYKYQDGLGYYESTRDMATNFFIGYLPQGTYVFEYDLRVSQLGNFSNGVTTIQCMYAPEFSSNSSGIRVNVKD